MAVYWWGVALAVALAALFVNALDLGYLPWIIAVVGSAVGGAISVHRKRRENNHRVTHAKIDALQELVEKTLQAVDAQSGPGGKSLVSAIDDVGSLVTRLYAERRHREVAAISAGATPLLEDISRNPPKTAEQIVRAVATVKASVMDAEKGEFKITGIDALLTHTDKDGNVIDER